jgi:hypothetical protein
MSARDRYLRGRLLGWKVDGTGFDSCLVEAGYDVRGVEPSGASTVLFSLISL